MANERLYLDTMVAAELGSSLVAVCDEHIANGCTVVIPNTVLDVRAFQENLEWFEGKLKDRKIVIQIFMTPDQMTQKRFLWSSSGMETPASSSFEEAITDLPNKDKILEIKKLMDKYGYPRGEWPNGQGEWAKPEPLSAEAQEILNLPADATRTEVLAICRQKNRMDLFNSFNQGYCKGLYKQHQCTGMITVEGSAMLDD